MADATLGTAVLRTRMDAGGLNRGLSQARQQTGQTFNTLDARMQRTGQRMQGFGRQASLFLTAPIVGLGVAAVRTAGQFEQSMNRVRAITGATGDDFERLRGLAAELGESTQFSASEAADGMGFLAQAGFEVDEIMSALPGTLELAAAGQLDLARAADLASNVLSGFGLEASEIGRVNDTMAATASSANTSVSQLGRAMSFAAPVAAGMGVSVEEASAAVGLLSNAGIQGERAGTALRGILGQLSQKSDELGISMRDAEGNMLPVVEILEQLEAQGFTAQDAIESVGLEAGPALQALLSQGSGALRELTGELEGAAGTAKEMADTQMEGLNGQLKELRSAAEGLAIAVGDAGLLEAVTNLAQGATTLARRFGELDEGTQKMIVRGLALTAAIGPVSLAFGKVVTIAPRVVAGLRAIRVAMAALAGPAGIIALVATGLGVTLVNAHRKHGRAIDEAIEKADEFQEKLGDADTPSSVRYAVNQLAREMEGDAKDAWKTFADEAVEQAERAREAGQSIGDVDNSGSAMSAIMGIAEELRGPSKDAWVTYAEQAIASAEDVQDVVRTIAAGRSFLENQDEINRLTRDLDELVERRDRVMENRIGEPFRRAQDRLLDLQEGLRNMEAEAQQFVERGMEVPDSLTRVMENRIEQIEAARDRLASVRDEQSGIVSDLNDQIVATRLQIDELSGTTVDIPDVNVEATVTGGGTGRQPTGGEDTDEDGVTTPPPPPEEQEVDLRLEGGQFTEDFKRALNGVGLSATVAGGWEVEITPAVTSPRSLGTGLSAGAFGQPGLPVATDTRGLLRDRGDGGLDEARTIVEAIQSRVGDIAQDIRTREGLVDTSLAREAFDPTVFPAGESTLEPFVSERRRAALEAAAEDTRVAFNDFTETVVAGERPLTAFELTMQAAEEDTRQRFNDFTEGVAGAAVAADAARSALQAAGEDAEERISQIARDIRVREGVVDFGPAREAFAPGVFPQEESQLQPFQSSRLRDTLEAAAEDTRVTFNDFTTTLAEGGRPLTAFEITMRAAEEDTRHTFNDFTSGVADAAVASDLAARSLEETAAAAQARADELASGFRVREGLVDFDLARQAFDPRAFPREESQLEPFQSDRRAFGEFAGGLAEDLTRRADRGDGGLDEAAENVRDSGEEFADQVIRAGGSIANIITGLASGDLSAGGAISGIGQTIGSFIPGPWGTALSVGAGVLGGVVDAFGGDDEEEQRREEARRRSRSVPAININFRFDQVNHYQGGPTQPQNEQAFRRQAGIAIEEFMNRSKLPQRVAALEAS